MGRKQIMYGGLAVVLPSFGALFVLASTEWYGPTRIAVDSTLLAVATVGIAAGFVGAGLEIVRGRKG